MKIFVKLTLPIGCPNSNTARELIHKREFDKIKSVKELQLYVMKL